MKYKTILLVEDETPKRAHINEYLRKMRAKIRILKSMSVTSTLELLESTMPDLMLLDMSLPTFDVGDREGGGRPQGFGGIEVLRHMSMSNVTCPTIVITGYEAFLREDGPVDLSQLRVELMQEFPSFFRGVLHYNSTFDEWKLELTKILIELGITSGDIC